MLCCPVVCVKDLKSRLLTSGFRQNKWFPAGAQSCGLRETDIEGFPFYLDRLYVRTSLSCNKMHTFAWKPALACPACLASISMSRNACHIIKDKMSKNNIHG